MAHNHHTVQQIYDKNLDLFFEEYLATSPDEMPYDDAIVLEKRKFQEHLLECLKLLNLVRI